jgi:hypothetical protein
LLSVLLVDVSIAAFTPIMIAAATGALVSVIALDEEIFCRSNSNKVLIIIILFSISY